jgi:AcrR family transcriptional regulator
MPKHDRQVRRTRELLQQALIDLIGEQRYDAITIQDIADRANVGRTTFYLHYSSKDDLFISCHEAIVSQFRFGSHAHLSRAELLSPDAPPEMTAAYAHLEEVRALLRPILHGKDSVLLLRRMRESNTQEIEASLRAAFPDAHSTTPLDLLATYLAGARVSWMHWWLEQRQPHSPAHVAQMAHRLQRAAIHDAFGLQDGE